MNISLNRVILFVQNVEHITDFYQKHFHFKLSEEIKDEWAVLKAGNCEIALHKAGIIHMDNDRQSFGDNNNVKLVFETDANLHQLREELVRSNVAMREIKSFGNTQYLYCDGTDIEGNVFQIMQKTF